MFIRNKKQYKHQVSHQSSNCRSHPLNSPYQKYVKRPIDIVCALLVLIFFWWLFLIVAILVRINLGKPVLFTQARPGKIDPKMGKEKIFLMYKFRSMSNECDASGNLLPDELRLGKFGKILRSTSLDELPEIFNILKGDMSIIGPRPQLVRDMVFMSKKHRKRHLVRPGLSGLAQVNGRNAISWEEKLNYDLNYIKHITFWGDFQLVCLTIKTAMIRKEGITENNNVTSTDYGEYLLNHGQISFKEYKEKQEKAKKILEGF